MKIDIKPGRLFGLLHIIPEVYRDSRGYFLETFNKNDLSEAGLDKEFLQDNESLSKKGVLRGLHFQIKRPQGKLVRCISGKVLDIAVDLRKSSPTYLGWESIVLDGDLKNMMYIPEGFAHGFLTISQEALFAYKCTERYYPEFDRGIRWNDPAIGIDWQIDKYGIETPVLSSKDASLPFYSEI